MEKLGFVVVRRRNQLPNLSELRIRKRKITQAHSKLSENNPLYRRITLDFEALKDIPEDGQVPWESVTSIIEEEN